MTAGAALAAKRGERGLTVQQVSSATHIRVEHLRALESDELGRFPAAVYAKGYLRTYARFLDLDPEPYIAELERQSVRPRLALGLDPSERKPRLVMTAPALAAAATVLAVAAFGYYAWRQTSADRRLPPASPVAALPSTPIVSPSIQPRPIVVGVRVTETVWINAVVDGAPQYGDAGRTLTAGSVVYFTGVDVRITSGRAAATYITIDGHDFGVMGTGVATREFSSQTSP